jgi:hypothetical protein
MIRWLRGKDSKFGGLARRAEASITSPYVFFIPPFVKGGLGGIYLIRLRRRLILMRDFAPQARYFLVATRKYPKKRSRRRRTLILFVHS